MMLWPRLNICDLESGNMDGLNKCEGVELCLDGCHIYLSKEGKETLFVDEEGKPYSIFFYLFDQYLTQRCQFSDFEDHVKTYNLKKLFIDIHILEENDDYLVVLSDCGNIIAEKIIKYISNNQEIYSSIKNLNYLNLFGECLELVGNNRDGDSGSDIVDTMAHDTCSEALIDPAPVLPVEETLTDGSLVQDPAGAADSIPDNQAEVEEGGIDYLLVYEDSGKSHYFIDKKGKPSLLAFDFLLLDLYSDVVENEKIENLNINSDSSVAYLKDMGFLDDDWILKSEAYTFIDDSLLPELKGLCKNDILNDFDKDRIRQYLDLKERFSEGDFSNLEETGIFKCFRDDYHSPDSINAVDPSPDDRKEAEEGVVPDQGETDAPVYPLSEEGIELAVEIDHFLVRDGDRLVVTDDGRKNETFMYIYGDKIDAVNNSTVSDTPEEALDMEDSERIYYNIAERTDKFDGVSIFFEGNEIPIVTLKEYGKNKKMLISPQLYALNIICMADKQGVELTKDSLEDKLEVFALSSAKHWISLLEADGCIIYDDGKLLPGQKLRDIVDLANTYLDGGYEPFEKPIEKKYINYDRINIVLTPEGYVGVHGNQTVMDTKGQSPFSGSRPIDRSLGNIFGKFSGSVDKHEGISSIGSDNGNLKIIYYAHDGSGADKESSPVKRLQINGKLTPAGERINIDNGNSSDSIVDALKEFGLLDSLGDLNDYGIELSKLMDLDWEPVLSSK